MWVTEHLSGMNKLVLPWDKVRTRKLVTFHLHLCHLGLEQDATSSLGFDVSSHAAACAEDTARTEGRRAAPSLPMTLFHPEIPLLAQAFEALAYTEEGPTLLNQVFASGEILESYLFS